jgi:primosomal protein N' (replication factor Y)
LKYCLVLCITYTIKTPLTYETENEIQIGNIVKIPLKNKYIWGIVIDFVKKPNKFETKKIIEIISLEKSYIDFIEALSEYYLIEKIIIYKKIIIQMLYSFKKNLEHKKNEENSLSILSLNKEQNDVVCKLTLLFNKDIKKPCLLHGVTGSGKTFIYIDLIQKYINLNQSIICLFPNAHLAHTVLKEIKKYINPKICFEYHSHGTKLERTLVWENIIKKEAIVICGVHIPICLPINLLGLIIIDEEHDLGYIDSRYPFFNIKEISLFRANSQNIPILLSSATPSINSFYQTMQKKYDYLKMSHRHFQTELPKINMIIMDHNQKESILSDTLIDEIKVTLDKKEQVLLFFNKKGLYRYAKCKSCNYKFSCNQCSILLTIYSHNVAKCNRCNYKIILPDICPLCSKKNEIKTIGYGLTKITQIVQSIFKENNVISIDGDILKDKNEALSIINNINEKKYDIIIGTQVITKGYNFNNVSLVGIINADQNFCIPNFMIMEETIQQYIQVSGRAGRKDQIGKVIIQSWSDISYLKLYLEESNYIDFINFELEFRQKLLLPPFWKISQILLKIESIEKGQLIINELYKKIIIKNDYFISEKIIIVHYPEKALLFKIKSMYYYQIVIKSKNYYYIKLAIKDILNEYQLKYKNIYYIPNQLLSSYQ